jgi:hypothetical protein
VDVHRRPALFWPLLLMASGGVWLAYQLGYITDAVRPRLWQLWPVLLVLIGLDMLLGRRSTGRVASVLLLTAGLMAVALTWLVLRGP